MGSWRYNGEFFHNPFAISYDYHPRASQEWYVIPYPPEPFDIIDLHKAFVNDDRSEYIVHFKKDNTWIEEFVFYTEDAVIHDKDYTLKEVFYLEGTWEHNPIDETLSLIGYRNNVELSVKTIKWWVFENDVLLMEHDNGDKSEYIRIKE